MHDHHHERCSEENLEEECPSAPRKLECFLEIASIAAAGIAQIRELKFTPHCTEVQSALTKLACFLKIDQTLLCLC